MHFIFLNQNFVIIYHIHSFFNLTITFFSYYYRFKALLIYFLILLLAYHIIIAHVADYFYLHFDHTRVQTHLKFFTLIFFQNC